MSKEGIKPIENAPLPFERRLDRKSAEIFSILTDRGLREYQMTLGFSVYDIQDKKILDVGSGAKELFSKQAAKYGAEVYSLNPKLKKWYRRKGLAGWIAKDPKWQKRSVAARAQELPFAPESFDMATALWSISWYLNNHEERMEAVKQILGALKPGGKFYMAPVSKKDSFFREEDLEWLKKNNYSLEFSGYPGGFEHYSRVVITKELP